MNFQQIKRIDKIDKFTRNVPQTYRERESERERERERERCPSRSPARFELREPNTYKYRNASIIELSPFASRGCSFTERFQLSTRLRATEYTPDSLPSGKSLARWIPDYVSSGGRNVVRRAGANFFERDGSASFEKRRTALPLNTDFSLNLLSFFSFLLFAFDLFYFFLTHTEKETEREREIPLDYSVE